MANAGTGVEFDGTAFGRAEELCRIVATESTAGVSSLPVLAHKSEMAPVVRVGGKKSSEEGMFDFPCGVAVEYQTGNIYVSDVCNDRVQVFNSNGRYLYNFREKMNFLFLLLFQKIECLLVSITLIVCQFMI